MLETAQDLIRILDLERLEIDLFRGHGEGGANVKRVFGGCVIGQALAAAYQTVEGRPCHSLHAYFIRPGDPSIPIIYEVDRARDGGSFTTRRVIAIQHGKQIFNLAASFHAHEDGWNHQHDAPAVPGPDTLPDSRESRAEELASAPERLREAMQRVRPVEIRETAPVSLFNPEPVSDENRIWFRVRGPVTAPPWMQHCMMAYASDMALLSSGNRRHGLSWYTGEVLGASLDHAMWFHAPMQVDQWHLYAMDSPFAGSGRSFNRGAIFAQDGALVASTAQEGLMRRPRTAP